MFCTMKTDGKFARCTTHFFRRCRNVSHSSLVLNCIHIFLGKSQFYGLSFLRSLIFKLSLRFEQKERRHVLQIYSVCSVHVEESHSRRLYWELDIAIMWMKSPNHYLFKNRLLKNIKTVLNQYVLIEYSYFNYKKHCAHNSNWNKE